MVGLTKSELRTQVAAFSREFGFEDKEEVFFRGALAAQHPGRCEDIEELSPEDKALLRREVTHKWHLPRHMYFTIISVVLTGISYPGVGQYWRQRCKPELPARVWDRGQEVVDWGDQLGKCGFSAAILEAWNHMDFQDTGFPIFLVRK